MVGDISIDDYKLSYYVMSIYVAEDTKVNKVWTELEGYIKKLVHAEVYVESKEEGNVEGASAMNRTSFLGLTGAKVNKVWTELEGYIKKLVHAEVYVESKEEDNVEGASAMNRTSFLGLTGAKVKTYILVWLTPGLL
uniref:Uncharacterized protein n=1 Tax=Daucus carota subsp. sativus TaxID=79200 RepID=A0A166AWE1_DAUCS